MPAPRSIQSILVATDLAEGTAQVLGSVGELALASGASLHAVHAVDGPGFATPERTLLEAQREIHERRIRLLDVIRAAVPEAVQLGSARVHTGPAAEVILEEARATGADLIVLGVHQHRGIADRLLGSTAELVLRHATVPCLLLNGELTLPMERIVVPTDLSRPAHRALEVAAVWANAICREGSEISLAHVLDPSIEIEAAPWTEQEVATDLTTVAAEVNAGFAAVRVVPAVLQGDDPVEQLIGHAQVVGAGMIVLGTHGDAMIVRALLGSVSSGMVRRSPLPVLLVPRAVRERQAPVPSAARRPQRPESVRL